MCNLSLKQQFKKNFIKIKKEADKKLMINNGAIKATVTRNNGKDFWNSKKRERC